jgi:hypothetical protein
VPIALVESFTPAARRTPWLGYVGLAVTAVLFVLACALLFFFQLQDFFMATSAQFVAAAAAVMILIAMAVALRRLPRRAPAMASASAQAVPGPWLVGTIFFVLGSAYMLLARTHEPLPAALNVAGLLGLLAAGALLLWHWSHRVDWSPHHELAAAGGLLLTYAWYGFVQTPSAGSASPQIDLVGNIVFAAGAVVLLVVAGRRVLMEKHS